MSAPLPPDKTFPGWTFWVDAQTEGVFTVGARDRDGRTLSQTGPDVETLMKTIKENVRALSGKPRA